jgi:hypothetical protein
MAVPEMRGPWGGEKRQEYDKYLAKGIIPLAFDSRSV